MKKTSLRARYSAAIAGGDGSCPIEAGTLGRLADHECHHGRVIEQGVDELQGQYLADARAFGPYVHHILNMADMISGGIIKQFPARFH